MFNSKNCLKCKFCVKSFRSPDDGQEKVRDLTPENRKKAQDENFDFLHNTQTIIENLKCYKRQWDECLDGSNLKNERDRLKKRKCFYFTSYEKNKDKFLPQVDEEQKEQREYKKHTQTIKWSIISALLGAAIGLTPFFYTQYIKKDKAKHDKMVELVEKMLELHKKSPQTPQEKTLLDRQIQATDNQIDKLVYDLYGLTDEEVKIVEGE